MQYPLTDLQVFRTQKEAELGYIIAVTPRWQGYIPPSSVSGVTLQPPLNAPAGVISAIVVDGAADSAVKTGGTVSKKRKVSGPIVNAAVEELAALEATVEQNKRNARLQGLSRENETLSPALTIPPHLNAPAHEWNTPVGNYTLL